MKKSLVTLVSVLTVSATALAGCGGGASPTATPASTQAPVATPAAATPAPAAAKPFKVQLRHIMVKEAQMKELDRMKESKKQMEAAVPGLTLEMEGLEEQVHRWQKLRAEMSAGNPPTIFNLFGGTDVKDFAKTGNLLDITPILEELGLKDKFYNLSEFTVDGKIYGLPLAGFVEGVFYNKKIFADNNLQVPKTWDDLVKVADTLKAKNITPFALSAKDAWVIGMPANTLWVRTAGADIVPKIAAGEAKWTDANVVAGFAKLEEMNKLGFFSKNSLGLGYPQAQAEFRTGKAAMIFDGSWANGSFTDPAQTPEAANVGFFGFPTLGGPGDKSVNSSFSNGYGFSAKANDQEKTVIKEFIKAVYNKDVQTKQNKDDGWLPSMKIEIDGAKPIVAEIMATTEGQALFPAFDSQVPGKVNTAVQNVLQELIGGKSNAQQAAEKLQKVTDDAIKEAAAQKK